MAWANDMPPQPLASPPGRKLCAPGQPSHCVAPSRRKKSHLARVVLSKRLRRHGLADPALARIRCRGAVKWASIRLPAETPLAEAHATASRLALERCPEDGPAEVQGWLE